jgi:hypothetical protein
MTRGRNALGSWLLTVGFSYVYLSEFLAHRVEGRIATPGDLGLAALVLLSAGVSLVLTVRWASSPSEAGPSPVAPLAPLVRSPRRKFLVFL